MLAAKASLLPLVMAKPYIMRRSTFANAFAFACAIALSYLFLPNSASAQQQSWYLQNGTTTVRFEFPDISTETVDEVYMVFYRGNYPDRSDLAGDVEIGSPSPTPLSPLFSSLSCSENENTYAVCPNPLYFYGEGDFWVELELRDYPVGATTTWYWVGYNRTGTTVTIDGAASFEFDTTYNTRFTALTATTTPTASTTLTFYPSYLIDLDEVVENDPKRFPSQVSVSLSQQPSVDFGRRADDILPLTATGTATVSFETVEDGVYDFLVSFWNLASVFDNSKQPFDRSYIYGQVIISGGVITNFVTDEFYDGTTQLPVQKRPCGITDIDGCLYNAGIALFVPSDASIEDFSNLSNTLSERFPFAYVYDFSEIALSLYTSSTTETLALEVPFGNLGTTTLISQAQLEAVPFAPFIKATLGALLWLMFALYAYRRSLKIFNKTA